MVTRPATGADLAAIVAIYNHYIITSPCTFDIEPYTTHTRQPWFGQFDGERRRCLVATDGDTVTGYACSGEFKTKPAYRTSVEVSVYVAHETRHGGIGTALYSALFDALRGSGAHRAYAGITQPNEASMALHRRFGFHDVGVYREVGYKFDRYWDVAWLERNLD
ncbi:MAG: N-acetyltransferase [Pseudomonadales bacterium]|nr:N-acetyltransferase [Pseudomonadales bacterium]